MKENKQGDIIMDKGEGELPDDTSKEENNLQSLADSLSPDERKDLLVILTKMNKEDNKKGTFSMDEMMMSKNE